MTRATVCYECSEATSGRCWRHPWYETDLYPPEQRTSWSATPATLAALSQTLTVEVRAESVSVPGPPAEAAKEGQ